MITQDGMQTPWLQGTLRAVQLLAEPSCQYAQHDLLYHEKEHLLSRAASTSSW